MYRIVFHVPVSHLEQVKEALFSAGAGRYKNYSHCSWQTLGEGQFMPLSGSKPFLGEKNQVNRVPEYFVEMICEEHIIQEVIVTLKKTHPYEEPSYQVIKIEEF